MVGVLVMPAAWLLDMLVMPATRVLGVLVMPRRMMAPGHGPLVPPVIDVTRSRPVVVIGPTPNLGVDRAEVAWSVVVVTGVNVPARLHETIAIAWRNPVTPHPHEAQAGVLPIAFDPNRAHAGRRRAYDHSSWRRRRRIDDHDSGRRLLDDDCAGSAPFDYDVAIRLADAELELLSDETRKPAAEQLPKDVYR